MAHRDEEPAGLRMRAKLTGHVVRGIIWVFGFFKFVDVTIVNSEVVPKKGDAILAANHSSNLDIVILWGALRRHAVAIAKAELWKSWATGWLARVMGHIPVIRQDTVSGAAAQESAIKHLGRDGLLIIFPEATLASPGQVIPYKPGVARMALETGAPVIPVGLKGVNKVLPIKRDRTGRKAFFRKEKVIVTFGQPLCPADFTSQEELLIELRRQIEKLAS